MHPYMTAELVRQHRARLTTEAHQRRLAERVQHTQNSARPASRLAAAARLFRRRVRALAA